jgi:hypothetical protein
VTAVKQVHRQNVLKFEWPQYLRPIGSGHGSIMASFLSDLCNLLRDDFVLLAQNGLKSNPRNLRIVPDFLMDAGNSRKPLIHRDIRELRDYVSPEYNYVDLVPLKISKVTHDDFIRNLLAMNEDLFRLKLRVWHVRLAKALAIVGYQRAQNIPLIPLRTGDWIRAADGPFFLPQAYGGVEIPEDIQVQVVDSNAMRDRPRVELYRGLGASELTSAELCNLIVDHHESLSESLDVDERKRAVLTAHAWYMFKHSDGSRDRLHVAVERPARSKRSIEVYMSDPGSVHQAKSYLPSDGSICHFLHPDYL